MRAPPCDQNGAASCVTPLASIAVPGVPVFANTGLNLSNVGATLAVADGAVVGAYFKRDGVTWNDVDPERVRSLMAAVKELRHG